MRSSSLSVFASAFLFVSCTVASPQLLEQPEGLPKRDSVVINVQNFPSLEFVRSLEPAEFPVYGVYTWMGEFVQLYDEIQEVGYRTLRVGGKYSDENMKRLFDSGLNFSLMAPVDRDRPGGKNRDAFESEEAYIEFRLKCLSKFMDRFGEGGTFYQDFPQYEGRYIPYMQLQNEPNFHYMYAKGSEADRQQLYAKLSPLLSVMIKERSPQTKVVGFSAGGAGSGDMRFVRAVLKNDPSIIEKIDVFATHPYVHPAPPEMSKKEKWGHYSMTNSLEILRKNFAEYGREKLPVWYTEGGWTISKADGGAYNAYKETVPLMHHAAYSVRYYAVAVRLGVQCVTTMFITDTDGHAGGHFDRLRGMAWRPTAYAIQNMIRVMPHPRLEAIHSDGVDLNFIYDFKSNAHDPQSAVVTMAYRIEGAQTVDIPVLYKTAIVTDMLGNQVEMRSTDGTLSVEIGPYPIYIQEKRS